MLLGLLELLVLLEPTGHLVILGLPDQLDLKEQVELEPLELADLLEHLEQQA
jgi:hypothetical protein